MQRHVPESGGLRGRWQFRNRRPTNHPRTSFQTRLFGTRSLRMFFLDGAFASLSDVVVLRFLTLYALAAGATAEQVGLLATANGLAGALPLVLGVWLAERVPSRKWLVAIAGGTLGRSLIVLMAAAPLALEGDRLVLALIAASALKALIGSLCHPAWMAVTAEIVPVDLRGFYMSRRSLVGTALAAAAAPAVGLLIREVGGLSGYQVAFAVSAVVGAMATFSYSRIEEQRRPVERRASGSTREMLRDVPFVRFLAGTFVLHTTVMIAGPFFSVYLVRELGATVTQVGLLSTIDAVAAVAGGYLAGRLALRYRSEPMLKLSLLLLPTMPVLWFFAGNAWQTVPAHIIGGIGWAMFNLFAFNLLLEYAPERNVPRYAAAQQIAALTASFLGPIIGTAIVGLWGIKAAMLISSGGRVIALAVMLVPMRAAVRGAASEAPVSEPAAPEPVLATARATSRP